MLSTGISCILLLINIIGIVNGGITRALEGENITLSCRVTGSNIEDKTDINALWKKETGQRVIWNYFGEKNTAETFLKYKFDIGGNLSLIINECNQADQGVYILCINGKPSCKVRLLITQQNITAKKCRRSTEKQCNDHTSSSDATKDLTDENNHNQNPKERKNYITIGVLLCTTLGTIFGWLAILYFKRKEPTKSDREHEVLNPPTVIQIS